MCLKYFVFDKKKLRTDYYEKCSKARFLFFEPEISTTETEISVGNLHVLSQRAKFRVTNSLI